MDLIPNNSQIIIYKIEDGRIRLDVRFDGNTVWLSQNMMADLFQTTQQNVSIHIQNIYDEGEFVGEATHKKYLSVQTEEKNRDKNDTPSPI